MIIYTCRNGIKVFRENDITEEMYREYGKRNLAIADENNFVQWHTCFNEKYNY